MSGQEVTFDVNGQAAKGYLATPLTAGGGTRMVDT